MQVLCKSSTFHIRDGVSRVFCVGAEVAASNTRPVPTKAGPLLGCPDMEPSQALREHYMTMPILHRRKLRLDRDWLVQGQAAVKW